MFHIMQLPFFDSIVVQVLDRNNEVSQIRKIVDYFHNCALVLSAVYTIIEIADLNPDVKLVNLNLVKSTLLLP